MHAKACKMSGIRVVGAGWERVSATARVVFIIYVCEHVVMALKYATRKRCHTKSRRTRLCPAGPAARVSAFYAAVSVGIRISFSMLLILLTQSFCVCVSREV